MFIARSNARQSAASDDTLISSVGWFVDLMTGSIAVSLCVLAVAFVGFSMFTGRLPIRKGLFVTLGAFILLAAPVVAAGFTQTWQSQSSVSYATEVSPDSELPPREDLPQSNYDPYAGASLRND